MGGRFLGESFFIEGQEHRLRRFWHRNGELDYEQNYINGEDLEKGI